MAYMLDLGALLTLGARFVRGDTTYTVETHRLDDVVLPTGQVVGCDPLVFSDGAEPFTVPVAPGTYPLWAWVLLMHRGDEFPRRRVAALQLLVRDEPVARWEMALVNGEDPALLSEDGFFGFPVDAGTATLADLVAIRALAGWDYERLEEHYIPDQVPEEPVPGAASAVTDEATGANVVITNSGRGDGHYPTFIGYTANDDVACVVTDFMLMRPDVRGEPAQ